MSCRTSRSAVYAGIALLDGGLSVSISGGRAPSWTSSRTSALTTATSRATRRRLLAAKDRLTGMIFAVSVERKGARDAHAVIKLTEWVDALGSTKVVIRSDGEPAIKQVAAAGPVEEQPRLGDTAAWGPR